MPTETAFLSQIMRYHIQQSSIPKFSGGVPPDPPLGPRGGEGRRGARLTCHDVPPPNVDHGSTPL